MCYSYEFTHRFDLPPLPDFVSDESGELRYDTGPGGPRIPVDFEKLEQAGYVKKIPICPTCGR